MAVYKMPKFQKSSVFGESRCENQRGTQLDLFEMSDSILKIEGAFFWADEEGLKENSVAGTLEIAENGRSTLSLVGLMIDQEKPEGLFKTIEIDPERCIIGMLKDSRHVLLRRLSSGSTTYSSTIDHQTIHAREAVVFRQLEELLDLDKVTKFSNSLSSLEGWISSPSVIAERAKNGNVTVRSRKQRMRVFRFENKTVRLRSDIRYNALSKIRRQSVTLSQDSSLEVQPKKFCDLKFVQEEMHLFEELVLLTADAHITLPWPTVHYGKESGTYYFERRQISAIKKIEINTPWVTLNSDSIDIGALLSNLKVQKDILGPGLYLYLGIRRGTGLYLENQFSTAIFGLESLHRRAGVSPAEPKLEDKVKRILACVTNPKDHTWLEGRLRNAAEPNLAKRLSQTFSELDIGLDPKTLNKFSEECAKVRNEIAHFGGQRDGGYDEFILRMHVLNRAVRPLYHAVLLSRIGLDMKYIYAYFHTAPISYGIRRSLQEAGLSFKS